MIVQAKALSIILVAVMFISISVGNASVVNAQTINQQTKVIADTEAIKIKEAISLIEENWLTQNSDGITSITHFEHA